MKLLKTIYKAISKKVDWFIRNGLDINSIETLAYRKKEWDWMKDVNQNKDE